MITLKKLDTLRADTRMRKIIRLLESFARSGVDSMEYLSGLLSRIVDSEEPRVTPDTRSRAAELLNGSSAEVRLISDLAYSLASDMGADFADWDFVNDEKVLDESKRQRFPISLVMDRIRSPFNVGSMFRTAESFGVSNIYLTRPGAPVEHPRTLRSAAGATQVIPHYSGESDQILELINDLPIFALEVGGTDISTFTFPSHGVMVVGSEELGVSPEFMKRARNSAGIVSIPLFGAKGSLNVSSACAIALHQWVSRLRS